MKTKGNRQLWCHLSLSGIKPHPVEMPPPLETKSVPIGKTASPLGKESSFCVLCRFLVILILLLRTQPNPTSPGVLVTFMSVWHQLESCEKGNLNWENVPKMLACGAFYWLMWEDPAPCVHYHSWASGPGVCKKAGWHGKQVHKQILFCNPELMVEFEFWHTGQLPGPVVVVMKPEHEVGVDDPCGWMLVSVSNWHVLHTD